jgi:hypothetical protein
MPVSAVLAGVDGVSDFPRARRAVGSLAAAAAAAMHRWRFTAAPQVARAARAAHNRPRRQHGQAARRLPVRLLLSRLTALRQLACLGETVSGAVGLPNRLPGSDASGCSDRLYSLIVRYPSRLLLPASVSFPLLTELSLETPMKDAELELLLSACRNCSMRCTVRQS